MYFDFDDVPRMDRYKLLVGTVLPRPIALVTTVDADGVLNAAPFSFFNAMCSDPPTLVFGVETPDVAPRKDTMANIRTTGDFVINLVSEDIAEAMNICATEFPAEYDEIAEAGLTTVPSHKVKPPRIAESPVAFECAHHATIEMSASSRMVMGRVVNMYLRDDLIDTDKMYVDAPGLQLIGRMHGGGWYATTRDMFEMPRIPFKQWKEGVRHIPGEAPLKSRTK